MVLTNVIAERNNEMSVSGEFNMQWFFDAMPIESGVRRTGGTMVSNKKRASCEAGYHWKYQYGIYTERGEGVPWWAHGTFGCGSRHLRQQSNPVAAVERERHPANKNVN